jgi:hypothetical protein
VTFQRGDEAALSCGGQARGDLAGGERTSQRGPWVAFTGGVGGGEQALGDRGTPLVVGLAPLVAGRPARYEGEEE